MQFFKKNLQNVFDAVSDIDVKNYKKAGMRFHLRVPEDSLDPEHVVDELRRFVAEHPQVEGSASPGEPREGATAPDVAWENHGPYAPQRSRGHRGRPVSPDPFMFHTTIWLEHDSEASARAHEEPTEQLRDRVRTMEANLETLRTRLTQVADLRDAQGLREGHRALTARLTEIEECASVHTLREFIYE